MTQVVITLGVFICLASVPLAAIITNHLRKMALIIYGPQTKAVQVEAQRRMEEEVAELKQIVAEQAILLDDLGNMHRRLLERSLATESIQNRLER